MNIHFRRKALTRRVLPGLMLLVLAASASTQAVSSEGRYEMTFYEARPGGAEIATGDYDAAIATAVRVAVWHDALDRFVAKTNLCVAYAMTGALEQAERSCSEAVRLASSADRLPRLRRGDSATAMALNNRGVVRALRGDAERASADFRRAALHVGAWGVPERNSRTLDDRLASHLAVVRATRN
jgi:Flp pilus assembly protein TadD